MKITSKGTYFHVVGPFEHFESRDEVYEAIKQAGGRISKSVSMRTQVLVFGRDFDARVLAVHEGRMPSMRDRHLLPMLRESELLELMREGEIESAFMSSEERARGEQPLNELLGEVRGVLGETPSVAVWQALTGLVDACSPEHLSALVSYIFEHTQRWSEQEKLLCEPPIPWLLNMSKGMDSPAYKLVRRLDFSGTVFRTTQLKKALKCEHLVNVSHLNIGVRNTLTRTTFMALGQDEKFASVTHLGLGHFEAGWLAYLDEGGVLTSLRSLELCLTHEIATRREDFKVLLGLKMCAQIKTLTISSQNGWRWPSSFRPPPSILELLKDSALLPRFERLRLDLYCFGKSKVSHTAYHDSISALIGSGRDSGLAAACARVETFTLVTPMFCLVSGAKVGPYDFSHLPNLRTLRLYGLGEEASRRGCSVARPLRQDLEDIFHVQEMILPGSLRQLRTNAPLELSTFVEFMAARPDVEVVRDPLHTPLFE